MLAPCSSPLVGGGGGGGEGEGEGEDGSALQQLQAYPTYSSALLSSKFSWFSTYTAQNHIFTIEILGLSVSAHMTQEDPKCGQPTEQIPLRTVTALSSLPTGLFAMPMAVKFTTSSGSSFETP